MTELLWTAGKALLVLVLAPIAGGLLTGIDRIISARMQSRKGPPLLQPFYDVVKLLQKKSTAVSSITRFFVTFSLCFTALTVVLLCMGVELLLCIFAFTLGCVFFVLAGYSSYSPYSFVGTERELIQIMCYEPMVLITAFGLYQATGSFSTASVFEQSMPAIVRLPLIFIGFSYILTVKLRKSPFDLSMSHHGHQEIVGGIKTELTGVCLAMVEITHWYETMFALGIAYLFFVWSEPYSRWLAVLCCLAVFFLEILIDNGLARVRWKAALTSSWLVTGVLGGINLYVLNMLR